MAQLVGKKAVTGDSIIEEYNSARALVKMANSQGIEITGLKSKGIEETSGNKLLDMTTDEIKEIAINYEQLEQRIKNKPWFIHEFFVKDNPDGEEEFIRNSYDSRETPKHIIKNVLSETLCGNWSTAHQTYSENKMFISSHDSFGQNQLTELELKYIIANFATLFPDKTKNKETPN